LQKFVDENDDAGDNEEPGRASEELRTFWEKNVAHNPQKLGAFVGVLRELRRAVGEADVLAWWQLAVKPVISSFEYNKAAVDDAKGFVIDTMLREVGDDEDSATEKSTTADRLCDELLDVYIARSKAVDESDGERSISEDAQVAQQVQDVLTAFGRKRPKTLFHRIDDLVRHVTTRLQALTLLSSFLRYQTAHLYLVINTPLVEDLLKCLMNDTSTTVLSVALTSLIMLLPHIPGSLGPHLPRLFLVYSRLLCWEKFSPLSTEAERNLVTDDRLPHAEENDGDDQDDVGIDSTWEKARPADGIVEASTPELMTYFTYLYGLYPLNFTSYIRKPRRYLKSVDFPGADAFDLDQAVIRSRTEQFRQLHLLHPNFYHLTIEEEMVDPKWLKMDPADVVGDCHGLRITTKPILTSPGPPPTGKLPEIPLAMPLGAPATGNISPAVSHMSLRSGVSWRDTTTTSTTAAEPDSPTLKPQLLAAEGHPPDQEKATSGFENNLPYLQRQIALLRNEVNFERWHKAQYSQHIGQIMRRNVKEATVEAETLNLINANRALKKQVEQMRKAREATIRDSALTRKQTNSIEADVTERFNKFKQEKQAWRAEAEELERLRSEVGQYRELLVATEARELKKSHQLRHAQRKVHEYEFREFEFDNAKRQNEILQGEKEKMLVRVQKNEQDHTRLRQAYASKVAELETQLGLMDSPARDSSSQSGGDIQGIVQQAVYESQAKLAQLKKAYSRLVEKHTDLELEYQSVKNRLEVLQGDKDEQSFYFPTEESAYGFDIISTYAPSETGYTGVSTSEPTRRFHPVLRGLHDSGQASLASYGGLTSEPSVSRKNSMASGTSSQPAAFNQSAPLRQEEMMSTLSDHSGSGSQGKTKITTDSNVRVYGRGKCTHSVEHNLCADSGSQAELKT
jgi:hypothetical protein